MDSSHQDEIRVTKRIDAPAAQIFAVLSNPTTHAQIDGSGTVKRSTKMQLLTGVGDVFRMQMGHPEWGSWEMDNYVTCFETDRLISWEPRPVAGTGDPNYQEPGRHVWSYELTPDGGSTIVTESLDFKRSPEWLREALLDGDTSRHAMTETLDNLSEHCVAAGAASLVTPDGIHP